MTPIRPADEALVEATVSAYRDLDPEGRVRAHPAWHDLDAEGRRAAFDATAAARRLEALVDSAGLSSTARAVLARVAAGGRR
jgi:hypothetical protein